MKRTALFAALFAISAAAHAIDGEIVITHAKALTGNVTPGDAPGYPVTLSLPGKYKLGSNLVQPNNNTQVIVGSLAGGVMLDLNGFSITGQNYCPAGVSNEGGDIPEGICTPNGNGSAVELPGMGNAIRNGRIFGIGGYGVAIENGVVENLDISWVGKNGVYLYGKTGQVRGSSIREAFGTGLIAAAQTSLIANNTIYSRNFLAVAGAHATVTGNTLHGNVQALDCTIGAVYSNNMLTYGVSYGMGTTGACQDGGGNFEMQQN